MANKDKWTALTTFWNSFGIPAYDENAVPDGATFPRITYNVSVDGLGRPVFTSANVWYHSTSWKEISLKVNEIEKRLITMHPPALQVDEGRVYITKGTPFAQRMGDPENDMIRRVYINLSVEYLTN